MFSWREADSSGMGMPGATLVFAVSPRLGGAVRVTGDEGG